MGRRYVAAVHEHRRHTDVRSASQRSWRRHRQFPVRIVADWCQRPADACAGRCLRGRGPHSAIPRSALDAEGRTTALQRGAGQTRRAAPLSRPPRTRINTSIRAPRKFVSASLPSTKRATLYRARFCVSAMGRSQVLATVLPARGWISICLVLRFRRNRHPTCDGWRFKFTLERRRPGHDPAVDHDRPTAPAPRRSASGTRRCTSRASSSPRLPAVPGGVDACPSRSFPASRGRTVCRTTAGSCRRRTGRRARSGRSRASALRRSRRRCCRALHVHRCRIRISCRR